MEVRAIPITSKFTPKQQLNITTKHAFLNTFSNERLNNALNTSSHSNPTSPSKQPSPIATHQKAFSFVVSPKFQVKNRIILSFDDFVQTKNTFRKLLKHSSLSKGENKIKNNFIMRKVSLDRTNQRFYTEVNSKLTKKAMPAQLEAQKDMRKDLLDKFEKTRLIFREQGKLKQLNKINRIYERKNAIFDKLHKSEDVNQLIKVQRDKLSPWIKSRYRRNTIYSIQENGESEDCF